MRILHATTIAVMASVSAGLGATTIASLSAGCNSCGGEITKLPVDDGLRLVDDVPPPPPPPPRPSRDRDPEPDESGFAGGPPPPGDTTELPPAKLAELRTAGETQIQPDEADAEAIQESGELATALFELCLDASGQISELRLIKGSGFSGYDAKLEQTIETTWKFRPHQKDGKPAPMCSAVTFIYRPN